ncbi:hypothetical protein ACV795_003314 [Escherichia coli]|uniref:hypothetical protein n=1 Tax=Escherichia TaxID=561 RepID=UPI000B7D23B4|nr:MULTISPECIES: hypothetical protein [Escherichia]EGI4180118.1 hypothetical protein [Escherichia coli]EGW8439168.1 hypothetical protein [Escherichia coli]EHH7506263.1 hypothetical protein [Escherichia coli]EHH7534732.1 hypothetical protein [Escherichia coli]EHT4162741.1 hypothetical protein [Escherichia coli]
MSTHLQKLINKRKSLKEHAELINSIEKRFPVISDIARFFWSEKCKVWKGVEDVEDVDDFVSKYNPDINYKLADDFAGSSKDDPLPDWFNIDDYPSCMCTTYANKDFSKAWFAVAYDCHFKKSDGSKRPYFLAEIDLTSGEVTVHENHRNLIKLVDGIRVLDTDAQQLTHNAWFGVAGVKVGIELIMGHFLNEYSDWYHPPHNPLESFDNRLKDYIDEPTYIMESFQLDMIPA